MRKLWKPAAYIIGYIVFAAAFLWLVQDAVTVRINYAYDKGYREGLAAQSRQVTENQCIKWLFNTNLKEARKKVCTGK